MNGLKRTVRREQTELRLPRVSHVSLYAQLMNQKLAKILMEGLFQSQKVTNVSTFKRPKGGKKNNTGSFGIIKNL